MDSGHAAETRKSFVLSLEATIMPTRMEGWLLVVVHLNWSPLASPSPELVGISDNQLALTDIDQMLAEECVITLITPRVQHFFKEGYLQSHSHRFTLQTFFEARDLYFTWFMAAETLLEDHPTHGEMMTSPQQLVVELQVGHLKKRMVLVLE